MNQYPQGSIWRKWDLHVHSPASNNFSGDWNQFIIQLGNADCDVIGINDYFSVAGYKEILRRLNDPDEKKNGNQAYREALNKLHSKVLLPVVECRMNNIVIGKKSKQSGTRINFHLIFDNTLNIEDIETAIKGFKISDVKISSRYNDPKFLLEDASVDYFSTINDLKEDGSLRGHFLVWLPYDEYGGADDIDPQNDKFFKQKLINKADIMGSSNRKQIDFFLWKHPKFTEDQFTEWFGEKLPCIKGSDSHNANDEIGRLKDERNKPTNKYCWIKADPTFEGLRQICNEPEDRLFIGEIPEKLKRMHQNSTNYISLLSIKKVNNESNGDIWFDNEISLNDDMVAIIGNKGEGKSALTDILGIVCNTHCPPNYFSFLTKNRFREKNNRLASQFVARVSWADGSESSIQLDQDPDINKLEKAKYIPQQYLDTICTETNSEIFQKELRDIIFSHIPVESRLNCHSLDDLIQYRSEELETQLNTHRQKISHINEEIVNLEEQLKEKVLTNLESEKKEIEKKISAHKKLKPSEVPEPKDPDNKEQKRINSLNKQIEAKQIQIRKLDDRIDKGKKIRKLISERIALASKLRGRLENFQNSFEQLKEDTSEHFEILEIQQDETISFTLNLEKVDKKIERLQRQQNKLKDYLADEGEKSLSFKRQQLSDKVAELQESLSAPNKRYQAYLQEFQQWKDGLDKLHGDKETEGTLAYVEERIRSIKEDLPLEHSSLKNKREEEAEKLLLSIDAIREIYNELFEPVQKLISDNKIIKDELGLSFDSHIIEVNFAEQFFDSFITHGKTGTFQGKETGTEKLRHILDATDFGITSEAIKFASEITNSLRFNMNDKNKPSMNVGDQLRKGKKVQDVYDFIWAFEYLEPQYSLKLDEKDLTQLSPGERGTLLLVFYLLVDKSEYPIIIDQPEENLDSQTVYTLLRPVIKDVKQRRQIIMVTHHPNIAVACDAEQIVYCEIDRKNGYKVSYTCGSIESPQINRHILDVLEGTRPAFKNRDAKYYS